MPFRACGTECSLQGDDFLQKDGVAKFRTLRLLGDNEADDSSSSSDDDENVTSLHIPQDLILKASALSGGFCSWPKLGVKSLPSRLGHAMVLPCIAFSSLAVEEAGGGAAHPARCSFTECRPDNAGAQAG